MLKALLGIIRKPKNHHLNDKDVRALVFDHLNVADLTRAGAVSKSWRRTAKEPARIRDLYLHGAAMEGPEDNSWVEEYAVALRQTEGERGKRLDALMLRYFPAAHAQILAGQTIAEIHPAKIEKFKKEMNVFNALSEDFEKFAAISCCSIFLMEDTPLVRAAAARVSPNFAGLVLLYLSPFICLGGIVGGAVMGCALCSKDLGIEIFARNSKRRTLEDALMGPQRFPEASVVHTLL